MNARAFFLNADGNAVFFNRSLSDDEIAAVESRLHDADVAERKLTEAELETAGFTAERLATLAEAETLDASVVFGLAAKVGVYFSIDKTHRATHGYPLDYEAYRVFYAISEKNYRFEPKNILDVTKIVCHESGLTL